MLKKIGTVFVVCIIAVSLTGCGIVRTQSVSRGHNISGSDTNKLIKGTSTEKDVLKLFGPPTKVRDVADGREFYYEYAKNGGFQWNLIFTVGGGTTIKTLIIWLNKEGVVTDYAYKKS